MSIINKDIFVLTVNISGVPLPLSFQLNGSDLVCTKLDYDITNSFTNKKDKEDTNILKGFINSLTNIKLPFFSKNSIGSGLLNFGNPFNFNEPFIKELKGSNETLSLEFKFADGVISRVITSLISLFATDKAIIKRYTFNFYSTNLIVTGLQYIHHSLKLMDSLKTLSIQLGYNQSLDVTSAEPMTPHAGYKEASPKK